MLLVNNDVFHEMFSITDAETFQNTQFPVFLILLWDSSWMAFNKLEDFTFSGPFFFFLFEVGLFFITACFQGHGDKQKLTEWKEGFQIWYICHIWRKEVLITSFNNCYIEPGAWIKSPAWDLCTEGVRKIKTCRFLFCWCIQIRFRFHWCGAL